MEKSMWQACLDKNAWADIVKPCHLQQMHLLLQKQTMLGFDKSVTWRTSFMMVQVSADSVLNPASKASCLQRARILEFQEVCNEAKGCASHFLCSIWKTVLIIPVFLRAQVIRSSTLKHLPSHPLWSPHHLLLSLTSKWSEFIGHQNSWGRDEESLPLTFFFPQCLE